MKKKFIIPMIVFSNLIFSFCQCSRIAGISSVRSLKVKSLKPAVWVESIAEGSMQVSIPQADRMGSATVIEHCPTQEISWMVKILGYDIKNLFTFCFFSIIIAI